VRASSIPAPSPSTARFARNVPLLYLARLLFWMHFFAAILVPFFRDWGGLDLAEILLLNAWFMAWNSALEVPTGAVADRFGRRASLLLGLAAGAFATGIYVAAPALPVFLVAEVVMALAYALISGADEALLYDSLLAAGRASEAQRAIARLESVKLLGIVLGALGGAALTAWLPLRGIFALQALPMTLAVLVALALVEPPGAEAAKARASLLRVAREGLALVLGHPALRRVAVELVTIGALSFLVIWLYQPLLEAAGIPLAAFGPVHVALSLGQIAVLQAADRLEDLLGSRARVLLLCAVAAGLGWIGLGFAHAPWWVAALVVAAASFGLARGPLLGASLHAHLPSDRRATALSGVSMLRTLGVVLANGAAGLAAERSLHATALGVGVLLVALGVVAHASRVRQSSAA
jgi:MFS family permease